MAPYIGRRMRRVEDERLITGRGRFAGDVKLDGAAHIAFCRSTLPHARIRTIDVSAARDLPGVLAVWTADDLPKTAESLSGWGPRDMEYRPRGFLARDEVRYVGEAYALVVAETAYQAQDAAEQVVADLDPLPGAGTATAAVESDDAKVHADMKDNIAWRHTLGYGDIGAAFAPDTVSAKIHLTTSRVAGAAMEPRAVSAAPDGDGLEVWTSTQSVFGVREEIAKAAGLEESQVRVLAEDVGGGFGAKGMAFPEEVLTALVAKQLNRPAQWISPHQSPCRNLQTV
ncbi:MAG TPA: molybdopterin cofactor-binding domain-containing protein, partial [Candidatus Dormibacteraeota bacterium]|nr:molybdopterin cofactor-binding domain-containing protein [Candidatus Dormibacteraeota bacterium]